MLHDTEDTNFTGVNNEDNDASEYDSDEKEYDKMNPNDISEIAQPTKIKTLLQEKKITIMNVIILQKSKMRKWKKTNNKSMQTKMNR
jgi:hypothetical protein